MFCQWILGQNLFKNVPIIALIILDQSGPPPTTPNPFSNFYRFSYFYIFLHILPTPAATLAAPCFLFLAPTSPQDLKIRIKHRELVLKAARISNFITSAPFWCKINANFTQNCELMALHCHLIFVKRRCAYEFYIWKLWDQSEVVDLVFAVRTVPLTPLET